MILIGCGAQAKYVLDILNFRKYMHNQLQVERVLDPVGHNVSNFLKNFNIEKYDRKKIPNHRQVGLCIASVQKKYEIYSELSSKELEFPSIIHKDS